MGAHLAVSGIQPGQDGGCLGRHAGHNVGEWKRSFEKWFVGITKGIE